MPPPLQINNVVMPSSLRWLRLLGWCEGVSTIALFGIAMPLKYAADLPQAVTVVGSVHGGLFITYVAMIALVMVLYRWPLQRGCALLLASIVPFGPFILDRRIPRWYLSNMRAAPPATEGIRGSRN